MCRWLAYTGNPLQLETVIFKAEHSLIDQSLHSRLAVTTTNGDGFGLGWYGPHDEMPFRYRSVHPAWNDRNLHDAARAIHAPMFLAHVRAATGTPVQETNCHPFRYGRWLFVHNGLIRGFATLRRELMLKIAPQYFGAMEGSTDSEVMFLLALTYGLESDPVRALESMAAVIEETGAQNGIEYPLTMTVCAADGQRMVAARYSSERRSRTLFHNASVHHLRELYPDNPHIAGLADDAYMLLSEPLTDKVDAWEEVPEATVIVAEGGQVCASPFVPELPPA